MYTNDIQASLNI